MRVNLSFNANPKYAQPRDAHARLLSRVEECESRLRSSPLSSLGTGWIDSSYQL